MITAKSERNWLTLLIMIRAIRIELCSKFALTVWIVSMVTEWARQCQASVLSMKPGAIVL